MCMAIHFCIHFWPHVGHPGLESAEDMNRVTRLCHACLFGSQLKKSRTMSTCTGISYECVNKKIYPYVSDCDIDVVLFHR